MLAIGKYILQSISNCRAGIRSELKGSTVVTNLARLRQPRGAEETLIIPQS